MNVTLYNSPGERNIIGRTKTLLQTMTAVQATSVMSVETPELLLDANENVLACDYVYVAELSRYYFVNSKEIINGNQYKLYLESDPLESFKSAILSSQAIAKRSTNIGNPEIEDPLMVFKNIPRYITRKCPTGFTPSATGDNYVLVLGGK